MRPLFEAGAEVQAFLLEQGWRFCFIGGIAVQRWGFPRLTKDIDLSLLTGFGQEERFADVLLERFSPRTPKAREWALSRRVLLVANHRGIGIDIAFAAFPFEEGFVDRATDFEFTPGISLRTCSAEDLIVMKAFAARAHDWGDVEGILAKQAGKLSLKVIQDRLRPLCELKETPEILERVNSLFAQAKAEKPRKTSTRTRKKT